MKNRMIPNPLLRFIGITVALLTISVLVTGCATCCKNPSTPPKGFVSLFNGKDLTGWSPIDNKKPSWFVENGILYTDGEGGGWLSSAKEYSNFELRLEFKVPVNGNSGVFIRAPHTGNPAFEGSEIQVLDDYGPEYTALKPYQYCGSIYSTVPPSKRASRPAGEWQSMQIRAEGQHVTVKLNGVKIVEANLNDHLDKIKDHPGLKRTGGFIGLQNHSTRVDFRNIYIRELP